MQSFRSARPPRSLAHARDDRPDDILVFELLAAGFAHGVLQRLERRLLLARRPPAAPELRQDHPGLLAVERRDRQEIEQGDAWIGEGEDAEEGVQWRERVAEEKDESDCGKG